MTKKLKTTFVLVLVLGVTAGLVVVSSPRPIEFNLGGLLFTVPVLALVIFYSLVGFIAGVSLLGRKRGSGERPDMHDPEMLLPRMLSKKVRQAIDEGYRTGHLEGLLKTLGSESRSSPDSLGLVYWRIRVLLDTGQTDDARDELVRLLPNLPEVALTNRWSALFDAAGERTLWIRNVLQRIRNGLIVRRSTFRELIRLLMAVQRYGDGLDVLQRLRETDPPAPEEDVELSETEMTLRIRLAQSLSEDGRFDDAMMQIRQVRERFSGWRAPYQVGFKCLDNQGDHSSAIQFALEGFRNTGSPDLLLLAYEQQIRRSTPVELLAQWDDLLSDVADDGWYQLVTGWLALKQGLVEEGVRRLRDVQDEDPAYGHARIILGGMNADRGHSSVAAEMLAHATWAWMQLPFIWMCGDCGQLQKMAPIVCPKCNSFQSFQMTRPYTIEEPAVARLMTSAIAAQ